MASISMDLVKQLRDKTQVGMMDCKKALEEAQGDFDAALDLLRKKGAAVAAKRADNATTQGRVECFLNEDNTVGVLVETACETDFSANTDAMKQFIINAATEAARTNPASIEELLSTALSSNPQLTVKSLLDELIAKICENIKINRFARFQVTGNGLVNVYVHPGSTIGVMVELATDNTVASHADTLKQIAKDVCMQAAVTNPVSISASELDPATVAKERAFATEQMKESGKPANVIEKIVEGKIAKFYQDACLLNQPFIKNDKQTVQQYIDEAAKSTGLKITVKAIKRFAIGR
jgi:elongation factor Ts